MSMLSNRKNRPQPEGEPVPDGPLYEHGPTRAQLTAPGQWQLPDPELVTDYLQVLADADFRYMVRRELDSDDPLVSMMTRNLRVARQKAGLPTERHELRPGDDYTQLTRWPDGLDPHAWALHLACYAHASDTVHQRKVQATAAYWHATSFACWVCPSMNARDVQLHDETGRAHHARLCEACALVAQAQSITLLAALPVDEAGTSRGDGLTAWRQRGMPHRDLGPKPADPGHDPRSLHAAALAGLAGSAP